MVYEASKTDFIKEKDFIMQYPYSLYYYPDGYDKKIG